MPIHPTTILMAFRVQGVGRGGQKCQAREGGPWGQAEMGRGRPSHPRQERATTPLPSSALSQEPQDYLRNQGSTISGSLGLLWNSWGRGLPPRLSDSLGGLPPSGAARWGRGTLNGNHSFLPYSPWYLPGFLPSSQYNTAWACRESNSKNCLLFNFHIMLSL